MNNKVFILLLLIFACKSKNDSHVSLDSKLRKKIDHNYFLEIRSLSSEFNEINSLIRNNKISRSDALGKIQVLLPQLRSAYLQADLSLESTRWTFPIEGYSANAIGGKNGNGYLPSGYDYFDGNLHTGHAAHDIFIQDKNQDCLDDRTNKYVNVLSVSQGIIVATEMRWDTLSKLRGGKYIWIYDPVANCLLYYAHNSQIFVENGQIVRPGEVIGTVGRSGLNAHKKRSPTHLHITKLELDKNFNPRPSDAYPNLMAANYK